MDNIYVGSSDFSREVLTFMKISSDFSREVLKFMKISSRKAKVFRHFKKKPIKRLGFLIEASLKCCKTR